MKFFLSKIICSRRALWVLLVILFYSCSEPHVPGGRIIVKNDIMDKEFNVIVVDNVVSETGLSGFRRSLKPGENSIIPGKDVRSLRFLRQYADFTRIYEVQCPSGFDREVTMKLIDVHSNRLGGGCKLVRRGKQSISGMVNWED